MMEETCWKNFARQTASLGFKMQLPALPDFNAGSCYYFYCTRKMESLAATRRWRWPSSARNHVPDAWSRLNVRWFPRRDWISCFANSTKNREAPQFRRREKVLAYGHHPSALTNHAPSIYSLQIGCPINSLPYFRLFQRGHFS